MLATMRAHAELPIQTMVYSVGATRVHRHRARLFVVQHDAKPLHSGRRLHEHQCKKKVIEHCDRSFTPAIHTRRLAETAGALQTGCTLCIPAEKA
jgi:hypothetical protein